MTVPAPQSTGTAHLPPEDEIRVFELLTVLVWRWRLVVGLPIAASLLGAVYSLSVRPVYTASASFLPEQSSQSTLPSGLAGLASQFGVAVGGVGGPSPRVYAEILKSRELTTRVLAARYPVWGGAGADSATLLDLLGIEGETPQVRVDGGLKAMESRVAVRVDNLTGVVRLSVDAPDRDLAAAVANRYIEFLNEFNSETRQSAARNRRRFIEGRIVEAEQALRRAEAELRSFYERNRSWQQSPQLVFEEGHQRRAVDLRQEVYVTLAREEEKARIEQVNDVDAITVIDRAQPPLVRSRPRRRYMVVTSFVLGGVLGVVSAFAAHFLATARRSGSEDYRSLSESLEAFRADIGRLWRVFPRRRSA